MEKSRLTLLQSQKLMFVVISYYKQTLPVIQAETSKPPEVLTALPLKWLTEKPTWVKQWFLTEEKLQDLEQLVQEQ